VLALIGKHTFSDSWDPTGKSEQRLLIYTPKGLKPPQNDKYRTIWQMVLGMLPVEQLTAPPCENGPTFIQQPGLFNRQLPPRSAANSGTDSFYFTTSIVVLVAT